MRDHVVRVLVLFPAMLSLLSAGAQAQKTTPTKISSESMECLECHAQTTAGTYQKWGGSKHFRGNVGCYECHAAKIGDADAFDHNGPTISIIVSPRGCVVCQAREVREFDESHDAKAGLILGCLDNFLADVVEGDSSFYGGSALTVSGCNQYGASMMAPDYHHWHGLYEVAKHWYTEFIPELREIAESNLHSADPLQVESTRKLSTAIPEHLQRPEHSWYTGNLSAEEKARRQKAQEEFKKRYVKA